MATFPCPHCGASIKHAPKLAGKKVPCPNCHKALDVPPLAADQPWEPPAWSSSIEEQPAAPAEPPIVLGPSPLSVAEPESPLAAALLAPPKTFTCATCGAVIKHRPDLIGQTEPCPRCGRPLLVPKDPDPPPVDVATGRAWYERNQPPSMPAWTWVGCVVLMVTLLGWFAWAGNSGYHVNRFHDDNAHGATANALEDIKDRGQWQIRIGDGLIIALLFMMLGSATMLRRELRLLREQLGSEKRNP